MRLTMPDRKPRHGIELVCELGFRPVAHLVARALLPLRVPPPAVVIAGACTGIAAAVAIGRHAFLAAAFLLQLKTLLDNADGQLARLSGRVTAFGRYLDSESDLLVDAALFAALGIWIGAPLALLGFFALTAVLSINFNVERLYRGVPAERSDDGSPLGRAYSTLYGWQDRLADRVVRRRPHARVVGIVANFGLSTQLALLGLCLALGHPTAYLVVICICALSLVPLLLRRERLLPEAA
jgi:archaetidylinositol phosphate synthase